jgi:hypothetical protein
MALPMLRWTGRAHAGGVAAFSGRDRGLACHGTSAMLGCLANVWVRNEDGGLPFRYHGAPAA